MNDQAGISCGAPGICTGTLINGIDLEPSTFIQCAKFDLDLVVQDCRNCGSHGKFGSFKILQTVLRSITFELGTQNAVEWNAGAKAEFKDHRRRALSGELTYKTGTQGEKDVCQYSEHIQ